MHIISMPETIRCLIGGWRVFLRDPSALAFFKSDIADFWKSFWCAGIILPVYTIFVILRIAEIEAITGVDLDLFRVFSIEMIGYVIGWVIWPLVMLKIVTLKTIKLVDRQKDYLRYMVVYNWSQAPVLLFALTMVGLQSSDIMSQSLSLAFNIGFYVWIIAVHVFIFKITMQLTIALALPLAFAEIILGLIILAFKYSMLGIA